MGVLPGVIGTIQATEVVKLIIGQGEPLIGRLLLYDALEMSFTTLKLRKNPDCVICSDHPTLTHLIDYDQFCGVVSHDVEAEQGIEITVKELKTRLDHDGQDLVVIDVREPHEWYISHLDFAKLIPKGELPDHLKELDSTKDYVLHCKSGVRSLDAAHLMKSAGFRVKSLRGGINAWAREIDPSLPQY